MTTEDIEKMPIEKIIHLPEFHSLESCGGVNREDIEFGRPLMNPYWKISFKADRIKGTPNYKCFDREIMFSILVMYKYKNTTQQIENQ